jgi:hypothetical protein
LAAGGLTSQGLWAPTADLGEISGLTGQDTVDPLALALALLALALDLGARPQQIWVKFWARPQPIWVKLMGLPPANLGLGFLFLFKSEHSISVSGYF